MIKLHKGDRGRDKWKEFFHSRSLLSVLMLTLTFAIILGVLMIVATPKRHDLKVGDIAGTTITATKDIEDAIATEKLRQAAAASIVEGMTKLDSTISQSVDDQVLGLLTSMMELREEYRAASIVITPTPPPTPTPSPETEAHEAQETQAETAEPTATLDLTPSDNTADLIAANQQKVIADAEDKLSELKLTTDQIAALLTAEESTFDSFCDVMLTLTRETMEEGVRDGQLSSRLQTLHLQILGRGVSGELLQVGYAVVDQCVKENVFIDEDATQEERQKAADAVEPVMYKKGQNIVQAGEVVTAQQLALLSNLGLLEDTQVDTGMYIGMAVLVLLMYAILLMYLYQFERNLLRQPKFILLLSVILLLQTALGLVLKQINIYLIPVQMATILIAMLLKHRLALTVNIISGVIAGILSTGNDGILTASMFHILLMSLFGGAAAVYLSRRSVRRSVLLYAGFGVAVVNFLTMLSAGVLTSTNMQSTFISAAYGAGGGLLSAVLAVGVMPLMENGFNLVTPQVLLELSMPTQPLLRLLQTEAPGTHQHSLMVANLAEAAADRVGANALLCRVGAYYHDVGKTRRPIFFKENQIDQPNPHDGMDPAVSAAIISAHVTDGMALADQYKLPQEVKDMIEQHHGDSVIAYFYYAAKKKADEEGRSIDIRDYSYHGRKPQTKEAAILMMADTVEAATRTLKERTRENMTQMIRKLVRDKFDSGELNESPITFRELNEISDAFVRTLMGIYHERIEYPNLDALKKESAAAELPAKTETPQK